MEKTSFLRHPLFANKTKKVMGVGVLTNREKSKEVALLLLLKYAGECVFADVPSCL